MTERDSIQSAFTVDHYRAGNIAAVDGQQAVKVWLQARQQIRNEDRSNGVPDSLPSYAHDPANKDRAGTIPEVRPAEKPALTDPAHPLGPKVEVVPFDRAAHHAAARRR